MVNSNLPEDFGLPKSFHGDERTFINVMAAFASAMIQEHLRAREDNFEPFHSYHEAYAVLLEEVQELQALVFMPRRIKAEVNPVRVRNAYITECIQIATMAFCIVHECVMAEPHEVMNYDVPDGPPEGYTPSGFM